jgi:hydrogenase maturation protein HypF
MAAVWLARAFPAGVPALHWNDRRDPWRLRSVLAIAASGVASPPTSSCGRLFDAVASLLDLVDVASHEGEAALALESLASEARSFAAPVRNEEARGDAGTIEVASLVRDVVTGVLAGSPRAELARAFHEALASRLAAAAIAQARRDGIGAVALTGGCLQNRLLSESLAQHIAAAGLTPLRHRRVPPGDGGLAVGQLAVAAAQLTAAVESDCISPRSWHDC